MRCRICHAGGRSSSSAASIHTGWTAGGGRERVPGRANALAQGSPRMRVVRRGLAPATRGGGHWLGAPPARPRLPAAPLALAETRSGRRSWGEPGVARPRQRSVHAAAQQYPRDVIWRPLTPGAGVRARVTPASGRRHTAPAPAQGGCMASMRRRGGCERPQPGPVQTVSPPSGSWRGSWHNGAAGKAMGSTVAPHCRLSAACGGAWRPCVWRWKHAARGRGRERRERQPPAQPPERWCRCPLDGWWPLQHAVHPPCLWAQCGGEQPAGCFPGRPSPWGSGRGGARSSGLLACLQSFSPKRACTAEQQAWGPAQARGSGADGGIREMGCGRFFSG